MARWFDAVGHWDWNGANLSTSTFIPFRSTARTPWLKNTTFPNAADGKKAFWLSWPRMQKNRVFCYANGQLRKDEQNDEILRFVDFWKDRTGQLPEELIFDSKLTTYAKLNQLHRMGIDFITIRRRSARCSTRNCTRSPSPPGGELNYKESPASIKTPRILDRKINSPGYQGPSRQVIDRQILAMKSPPSCSPTNCIVRRPS